MSFLPAVSAGLGIASSLGGLFGGNDAPPAPPPAYQPQYSNQADISAFNNIGTLGQYNSYAASLPQAGQVTQNLVNNPYAGQYQQGANQAAGAGWNVGGQQIGAGLGLMDAGQQTLPYAQSILQTGFDPQSALYNQQFQLQQDQQRAGQAARGISMTPYGAGLENKANSDFDIAWQNAQLGRQNTALQGAGYGLNSAGNAINLGQNVSTLGVNGLGQAAAMPYSTANTIGTNQLGALGQYGQLGSGATSTAQQQIADYLQYLGIGNQAAGVANQSYANQLTAQNQQFNQGQTLGKNLGSSLSGLGTWYGKQTAPATGNLGGLY
jgi:hypothetical protein